MGPLTEVRLWSFATGSPRPKAEHIKSLLDLLVAGTLADARVEIEGAASPAGDA